MKKILITILAFGSISVNAQTNFNVNIYKGEKAIVTTKGCSSNEYATVEINGNRQINPLSSSYIPRNKMIDDGTNVTITAGCAPKKCLYHTNQLTFSGYKWVIELYPDSIELMSDIPTSHLKNSLDLLKSNGTCKEIEKARENFSI